MNLHSKARTCPASRELIAKLRLADENDLQELVDAQLTIDTARGCQPKPEVAEQYAMHYAQYQRHVDVVGDLYR